MLSGKDPIWVGLVLALLVFASLIVVEISQVQTYVDVRLEVEGYTIEWSQPERQTIRLEGQDRWPQRYFISRRSAQICPIGSAGSPSFEAGLQNWAAGNNWEIINPSVAYSCQEYAGFGLDVWGDLSDSITLKPLGWDEGMQWNATLCLFSETADPCMQMTIVSIVPSFGVMVANR